jgi:hypothetical protein
MPTYKHKETSLSTSYPYYRLSTTKPNQRTKKHSINSSIYSLARKCVSSARSFVDFSLACLSFHLILYIFAIFATKSRIAHLTFIPMAEVEETRNFSSLTMHLTTL